MRPEDEAAAPFVPWAEFLPRFVASWHMDGGHVSLIGQTRSGKSTLALELLKARTDASARWHSLILANKSRDAVLTGLTRQGWSRVRDWPPRQPLLRRLLAPPIDERRLVLWPTSSAAGDTFRRQQLVFDRALRDVFARGRRAVYADEVRYLSHTLGLKALVELLWLQGGSVGIPFVAGTQRAAWVPLEFYSQARYLILFRERSPAARRSLTNHCGGADGAQVSRIAADLAHREFLVVDTWESWMLRSRVELMSPTAKDRT